jgi:hypothetical protein
LTQLIRELTERDLVVKVGVGLQVIAGCVSALGQLSAEVARDLLGEKAAGVLDGDDVRGAQDA